MKNTLIILLILFHYNLYSKVSCKNNKIYCQIIKNRPSIDKDLAMEISNIIYKYSREYNIDPHIYTAILAQESMYRLSAKNCSIGLIKKNYIEMNKDKIKCFDSLKSRIEKSILEIEDAEKECSECLDKISHYKKIRVCHDFGISQINFRTIDRFNLDVDKLLTDLEYSIHSGLIILYNFKKMYQNKEPDNYWSRYNSSTDSCRDRYEKLIEKWM